jgi:hypothetical protein
MTHDRKDAPLDPRVDADRWERAVHRITAAASPELRRLAGDRAPILVIAGWTRPVLAAAASVAALATATLVATRTGVDAAAADRPVAVADAIAPEPLASWLLGGDYPTVEEIVNALPGADQ